MIVFGETRSFYRISSRVPGVHRVATIGDSMTYGAAVPPAETLASHLESSLNAARLGAFFETVNLGRNGSNFWNAWSTFEYHFAEHGFDAVVLNICDNDTELFDGNGAEYLERPWEGSFQFSLMVQHLVQIKKFCDSRNILFILNFYTFMASDKPRIESTARACAEIGVPFIDMRYFLVEEIGEPTAQYVASPLDGHPNGHTHSLAARRIVDEMLKFPNFGEPVADVDIASQTWRHVEAMREQERPADQYLGWASRVLASKMQSWRRRLTKPPGISLGNADECARRIFTSFTSWYSRLALSAWSETLPQRDRDAFWSDLARLSARLRDLDELMYCAEYVRDAEQLGVLRQLLRSIDAHRTRPVSPPELTLADAEAFQADSRAFLQSLSDIAEGSNRDLPAVVGTFADLAAQLTVQAERYAKLVAEPARTYNGEEDPAKLLQQVIAWQIRQSRSWYVQFGRPIRQTLATIPKSPIFFTVIDVVVETKSGSDDNGPRTFLYVGANSRQPSRRRVVERQLCGYEKKRWTYRFEVPIFALADIDVTVPPNAPGHEHFVSGRSIISQIRIYNRAGLNTTESAGGFVWSNDQGKPLDSIYLADVRP